MTGGTDVIPITPNLTGYPEIIFAKNQPEYLPLPAVRVDTETGEIVTRWRLSWRERWRLFCGGDLYLHVLTFGHPLQPLKLSAGRPAEFGL